MASQQGRLPRQELQDIYDIARRAVADNEKFRQLCDSETGEPLGAYKNLERIFERVRVHFGLDETVVRR
jgi:hypothetical protein